MTGLIMEAIADYEANICMEFVERTTEQSYLHFMDDGSTGCWSYVGRRSEGVNDVGIAKLPFAQYLCNAILMTCPYRNVSTDGDIFVARSSHRQLNPIAND